MWTTKENIKNSRILRNTYYYLNGITNREKLRKKAERTIEKFGVEFLSEDAKKTQIEDMIRMNMRYGYGFNEYIYYHFDKRSLEERRKFVADWEHLGYTCAMNNPSNAEIFDNKWRTYQTYRPYYQRDVEYIEGTAGKLAYKEFTSRHSDFIVKPLDQSCGHGVRIICGGGTTFEELMGENKGRFLVEELINQSKEIQEFHPASVNTVRVPTISIGEDIHVVNPFFRIGQHGKHVDNAGSGGIICAVDASTGTLFAAADEYGKRFDIHPDTGRQIVGYKLPHWEKAKKLVKELAKVTPDNHYTGWDLALTDDGWILVEANRRGQFVWQIASQIGFRDEINHYLKELGVKY